MGQLVDGKWVTQAEIAEIKKGRFERPASVIRDWITQDGSSAFKAEPNRYHLYISYACPWACRTLIMRKLKGLEDVISLSYVDALMGSEGWSFGESGDDTKDPLYNKSHLHEIYTTSHPDYTGRVTVPVLWDKQSKTIVNNESAEIMCMLNREFNEYASSDIDYCPEALRAEIDEINEFVYHSINNGVYRCGFAKSQAAYDEAFDQLFAALDKIEARLSKQRYLVGDTITEADWRLFTTLIRFDPVYVGHFKCNKKRIADYPNLSGYLRELYQIPGVAETVRFDHIKVHYYASHLTINPTGIVPKGPEMDLMAKHERGQGVF